MRHGDRWRRRAGAGWAALLAGAGLATPALALLPPSVYENARRDAASIIVFEVTRVRVPTGYGRCEVSAIVRKVERGRTYRPGQAVDFGVPCSDGSRQPPLGPLIYQPTEQLAASRFGRAWLNLDGQVALSQYEILPALP